jgi:tetratricopeptide (TPR) repeat protein
MFTLTFKDAGKAPRSVPVPEGDRGVTVGRDPGCDVVLSSDQVSRRHARFRVRDGALIVEDLASHNGVRIAGRRIARTALPLASARLAHLQLGDVAVQIECPPTAGKRRLPPLARLARLPALPRISRLPRTRRSQAAACGVGLALALATACAVQAARARARRLASAEAAVGAAGQSGLGTAVEEGAGDAPALAEEARAALEGDRFDEAVDRARQAIGRDPLAVGPRAILAQAKRDAATSRSFAEASAWERDGREDEALRRYAQISPRSRLFPRARIAARQLRARLERAHASGCRTESSAGRWQGAIVECSGALDLRCQQAARPDDPLLALLRNAERRAGRRVPWTCPPELGELLGDGSRARGLGSGSPVSAAEGDPGAALAKRYPDPEVRDAVALYARGDASGALRVLSSPAILKSESAGAAQEASAKIRLVGGRFRSGQTALLRRELSRVDEAWGEALSTDAELLPPGSGSFFGGQMRATLAEAHRTAGAERFAKGQYASAHDEWMRGVAARPDDPALLDALAGLEKVADGLLSGPRGCESASLAARITRDDPPSPAHAAAQVVLSACP